MLLIKNAVEQNQHLINNLMNNLIERYTHIGVEIYPNRTIDK